MESHSERIDKHRTELAELRHELEQATTGAASDSTEEDIRLLETRIADANIFIIALEKGKSRLQRSFLRVWIGNAVMFGTFILLGLYYLLGSEPGFSRDERQWLESEPGNIPGLQLAPQSSQRDAAPARNASNFSTGRLKATNKHKLKVVRSKTLTIMALAFLLSPHGALGVELYFLYQSLTGGPIPIQFMEWGGFMQSVMLAIPFSLVGLYLLGSGTSNATLDSRKELLTLPGNKRNIRFRDVESLQLNKLLTTGERSYVNNQIQVNLQNGESVSLLSHADKEQIYVDIIRTALFMRKPLILT
ncbi:hypothetical protein CWE12_07060 [Aliidiomarina sedimenti]|uniref:DUF304 domain-containing protein n=2 Tax=Aliidiomarina sedimenti TaxID=1933879 RepID=A0ABY0BYF4_9GAMM|nr:hypothetical protein CWE12_07060 [Aliidiomarina sedimenti]